MSGISRGVSRRLLALFVAALSCFAIAAPFDALAQTKEQPKSQTASKAKSPPKAKVHRLAIHVDDNDAARMNLALNNASNVASYYQAKGEEFEIEIVTYGPGLHMLREDTSPVKERLKAMAMNVPELKFAACENTREGMKKNEGKDIPLVAEAKSVSSGVIRMIELQEKGWSYIRP